MVVAYANGSQKRTYTSDLYYGSITALDTINYKVNAKAVTDIKIRSGARDYAVGTKQYVAVQTSGRHLHPVKFDSLENSSYLFVFALN